MRQKVGVEHLAAAIDLQVLLETDESITQRAAKISELPGHWLGFCEEKLLLANESLSFLLRQRERIFYSGFPNRKLAYLSLIEQQMSSLKQVYVAFYRMHSGLIHQLRDVEPLVYSWLMLESEFSSDTENLISGLVTLERLEPSLALMIVSQCNEHKLDRVLADMIEGNCSSKKSFLVYLNIRQSLSIALCKHWVRNEKLDKTDVYPLLALSNVEDGVEWLDQQSNPETLIFERLMTKQDRGTWFRQQFGTEIAHLESDNMVTYAKLLELREFTDFRVNSKSAPIDFVLCGDSRLLPEIIEYVCQLDEVDGEVWIQALYAVYGSSLPLKPSEVGVDKTWEEVIDILDEWLEDVRDQHPFPLRLGVALSFESTLNAMRDPDIHASLRVWLWRHLCIHARAYTQWNPMMPIHQQEWNFSKLASAPSAIDRFNMRTKNAAVGY